MGGSIIPELGMERGSCSENQKEIIEDAGGEEYEKTKNNGGGEVGDIREIRRRKGEGVSNTSTSSSVMSLGGRIYKKWEKEGRSSIEREEDNWSANPT